jgi:hypothetical protein
MPKGKQSEYVENDGWGSAFRRPDNTGGQPQYTGQALDPDGNELDVAVWVRRGKNGAQYLRIHLQPPYEGGGDDGDDDELDVDEEPAPKAKRPAAKRAAAKRRAPVEDDEDDDELPF